MNGIEHNAQDEEKLRLDRLKRLILTDEQLVNHPFYNESNEERFYVVSLNKGEKRLLFFGSPHTNNTEDPVFEEIEKRFKETSPEIVFVEGMEGLNEHKDYIVAEVKKETAEEAKRQDEGHFALKLATDAGIDFESPELGLAEEIKYLVSQGFSPKDIFTYHLYREIEQYIRNHKEKSIDGCKHYIDKFLKRLRKVSEWNTTDMNTWEKEIFDNLDLDDRNFYLSKVDPVPWESKHQTIYNEISRSSGKPRDEYIFERIVDGLKTHNRVFVVYGSAHALRQELALRALFEEMK